MSLTPSPWEYDGNCAGYVRAASLPDRPAIARAYSVADARLIAAAPELLDAAVRVRARCQAVRLDPDGAIALDDLSAAIAKATGGEA